MNMLRQKYTIVFVLASILSFQACKPAKDNHPGSEYMPDMFHSIAYEANLDDYYYYNTWGDRAEYYQVASPRKPVKGTIPFGEFGLYNDHNTEGTKAVLLDKKPSGSVPFHYEKSEEGRAKAINEIRTNPFPITEQGLIDGKNLYTIYCGICHGDKGDGLGYLVRDDGGKYPVAPANLLDAKFVDTTAGVFYYAIAYGKNAMGSYADKLSYKERWDVIHYIRSLQAKEAKLTYSPAKNDFLPAEAHLAVMEEKMHEGKESDEHHDEGNHHSNETH